MLHPRLLAVRANDSLRRAQGVMGAALGATGFRVTTFWIRHNYSTNILDFRFPISDRQRLAASTKSQNKNLESQILQLLPT